MVASKKPDVKRYGCKTSPALAIKRQKYCSLKKNKKKPPCKPDAGHGNGSGQLHFLRTGMSRSRRMILGTKNNIKFEWKMVESGEALGSLERCRGGDRNNNDHNEKQQREKKKSQRQ